MIYLCGLITFFENSLKSNASADSKESTCFKDSLEEFSSLLTAPVSKICPPKIINFSWNRCLYISENETYLCGFVNGLSGQMLQLFLPDCGKVVNGCCSRNHCHLVTNSGGYWLYKIDTAEWKNMGHILNAEKPSGSSCTSHVPANKNEIPFVFKVSCGEFQTIAVADIGLYSVPSLLPFSKIIVADVCCGKEHALLLTEGGNIFSWGNGSRGQLGHGELETEERPRELNALLGLKVVSIAVGGWHSCCITDHGDLYSWGWNCDGQLGFHGEKVQCLKQKETQVLSVLGEPRPVDWPDDEVVVKQVSCGSRHTVAFLEDGTVWGCGWNKYRQLHGIHLNKVFGMTRLSLPPDVSKDLKQVICGEWISAFITR